jgi:hypothetical protein
MKDPIMGLVTKTVGTYMFLKHNNGPRQNNNQKMEDFSSWGNHFLKRKSESESKSESRKASRTYLGSERQKETIKSERKRGHQVKEKHK